MTLLAELCFHHGYRFKCFFSWIQKHLLAESLKVVSDGHLTADSPQVLEHHGRRMWGLELKRSRSQHHCSLLLCPELNTSHLEWTHFRHSSILEGFFEMILKVGVLRQTGNYFLENTTAHPHPPAPKQLSLILPLSSSFCGWTYILKSHLQLPGSLHTPALLSDKEVKCVILKSLGLICPFHLFWHDLMFQNL